MCTGHAPGSHDQPGRANSPASMDGVSPPEESGTVAKESSARFGSISDNVLDRADSDAAEASEARDEFALCNGCVSTGAMWGATAKTKRWGGGRRRGRD